MQSQTVTLIVAGMGICGTLGGLVTGHFLTRSWQREQWMRDKRNDEFRELLEALSESYRIALTLHAGAALGPEEQMTLVESQSKTMAVIRSRLFTAEVVRRCGIEVTWAEALRDHGRTLDVRPLAEAFTTISARIVQAATKGHPKVK